MTHADMPSHHEGHRGHIELMGKAYPDHRVEIAVLAEKVVGSPFSERGNNPVGRDRFQRRR